jgi:TolA-binding protein
MNRQLRAVGELERLLKRYPRSDKKSSALWRIGNAYDKLGDSTQALGYYFRVVEEFPSTDVARKASQRVAALSGAAASGRIVHTAAP